MKEPQVQMTFPRLSPFNFVRFLVDDVVYSIVFSSDAISVIHALPQHVIDRIDPITNIWRCDEGRCRAQFHDRCPCGRRGDHKADRVNYRVHYDRDGIG